MKEPRRSTLFWTLTGIICVFLLTFLDQLTKFLSVEQLKGQKPFVLAEGVLELSYLENRGMAFGLFQGKIPYFVAMCLLFFAVIIYVFVKVPKNRYYAPLMAVLFILFSGALGNFIDRVFRGYVVDFIYFCLIDFPTFNLADVYVVCGGILLLFFVCFLYREDSDFDFIKPGHK